MTTNLRTRLLLTVGGLALAALVAVALAARQGARQEFIRFQETERRAESSGLPDLARELAHELDGHCCAPVPMAAIGRRVPATALLVVTGADGGLVASAGKAVAQLEDLSVHVAGDVISLDATRRGGRIVNRIGLRFRLSPLPVRLGDGRPAFLFLLPLPDEQRDRNASAFLGSLDRRLLVATAVVAVLAVFLTWLLARGVVRPLQELRAATGALARGHRSHRVVPRGSRETRDLAASFNDMASALEREHQLRQDLVNDVAHELRTPLTALRCRLETVLDGLSPDPAAAIRDLHEEVLHLGRLVDDLQELATAEARELRLQIQDVGVDAVVRSAVRAAGLDEDSRVRLLLAPGLVARADAARLRQVVLNLLTNAVRHTPQTGRIEVRSRADGSEAAIEVENTGSHLDEDQLKRIFDRFYRADPARQRVTGGSGLGLAIVKHLVEAQGGRVRAASGRDTVTVGIALPAARE
ncbi:MAG TPA: ATP-binding protein [Vicinamibacterales bacterium]|jgi:signal transduction histidine kinase